MSPLDRLDREINYLRISVTDRCNLRCIYCYQGKKSFLPREEILTYEEIYEIIKVARALGIEKFRITGGEPLLRRGLLKFLRNLTGSGIKYALTTNGLLLEKYALPLKEIGLEKINISLDTLDRKKFTAITHTGNLDNVLAGIDAAEKAGFSSIKINTVVMKDINEDEIEDFIHFFKGRKNFLLRFIEYMPFQKEVRDFFFPLTGYEKRLRAEFPFEEPGEKEINGAGPARYYRLKVSGGDCLVGFITPRSQPFCNQCNRLRLTSDGKLKPCLASAKSYDLKRVIRGGGDSRQIREIFQEAINSKPAGHNFEFSGEMIRTGG